MLLIIEKSWREKKIQSTDFWWIVYSYQNNSVYKNSIKLFDYLFVSDTSEKMFDAIS